jgi:hypothetical protein
VLGGSLRFTRDATPVALPHPSWLHVGFVDVGAPAVTSSFVKQIRTAAEYVPSTYARAIDQLSAGSESFLAGYVHASVEFA